MTKERENTIEFEVHSNDGDVGTKYYQACNTLEYRLGKTGTFKVTIVLIPDGEDLEDTDE